MGSASDDMRAVLEQAILAQAAKVTVLGSLYASEGEIRMAQDALQNAVADLATYLLRSNEPGWPAGPAGAEARPTGLPSWFVRADLPANCHSPQSIH